MSKELERRQQSRVSYSATLYWAEYVNGAFPLPDDFEVAETNDLSPVGLSFFCKRKIQGKMLLIALTDPSESKQLLAAPVMNCQEGFWERERQFRVGCSLTGTIRNPLLVSDDELPKLRDKLEMQHQST